MIPKIIHYCWFGRNPLPELAIKCINSWKKYFPDYKIIEWNEDNYNVYGNRYIAEAYRLKKYAFVSDYCRFDVLYRYGGLYFDTDVEIIKDFTDILNRGPFMGCELAPISNNNLVQNNIQNEYENLCLCVAPGLGLGVNPGLSLYKEILEYYDNLHYINYRGKTSGTIVTILTELIIKTQPNIDFSKIVEYKGVYIYPDEYFCPIVALTGEKRITENTHSIHHYTASWQKTYKKRYRRALYRIRVILVRFYTDIEFCLKIVK